MNEQEIEEMLQLLHQAGMRAELCDTPVRLAGATAHCGDPAWLVLLPIVAILWR